MKKKRKIILLIALLLLLLTGVVLAFFFSDKGEELLSKLASSDSFNQGKYIEPDYKVDGELTEDIWETAPCIMYGNPETEADEVAFRFHYGERGVTASFVVTDPTICYAASAYDNAQIFKLSDTVFLYLDTKNDGNVAPQEDDIRVSIAADGRMAIARGSGSSWLYTNESIDYQVVADGILNESGGGDDVSWTAELFIPYETFGIDKEGTMGLMLEWADSNTPSFEATRYIWHNGGNASTILPELFHPIDKNGLAFAAPEGWVPSMGRFVSENENELVAEDVRALAYYRAAKMENGSGTVEATFDITKTEDFFTIPRFSGLLFGIDEVGETEKPGWEVKSHYGLFINDNAENPQLILSSIRIQEDGKVQYKQLTGKAILDILPNFLETKVCRVKVAKNNGWIEVYMQDAKGKYQHMFDMFEEEPINGDYVGVRTAVAGFTVRDVKVTTEKPTAVTPYAGPGFKSYGGLVQKLSENEFWARTPHTMATFGTLENKYKAASLKSITTSITIPERPSEPESKLKGILINYNEKEDSYLLLDYRHGEPGVKEWEEDYRFYIRHKGADKWGDVCFIMNAEANTTYDFRITPITTASGATDVLVEYKKSTESVWQAQYCKRDSWKTTGTEYGIYTQVGDQKFGAFKVVESDYLPLDEERYETVQGFFIGRKGGGVSVLSKHSTLLDTAIKLSGKNDYVIKTSYKIVPDQKDSIKGIVFNYNKEDGSYLVLDYRYEKEAYELYIRHYDGKKWAGAWKCDVKLIENAWYDFNIHVMNGKKTTTVIVESKTGDEEYTCISRILNRPTSGRQVGYYSTAANGIQFGEITVDNTNYIGAEDSRYALKMGAFIRKDEGVQVATKHSLMIDKQMNPSQLDNYAVEVSVDVVPDKKDSIKGVIFNYDADNGSYLVLDYRYEKEAYELYVREYTGKKWGGAWKCGVQLTENARYDFTIHTMNGENTTTVVVESSTGNESCTPYSLIINRAMSGRQVGYYSTAANEMQYSEFKTALSTYIGAEDEQYKLKTGAFFRVNGGVQVGTKHSMMLDKTIDLSTKKTYTVETSFKVVPDKKDSIKGIVFNYNEEDGSYLLLDYRYEREAYRLFVRQYTGKKWGAVWDCKVELKENAWYDFKINVVNQTKSTNVTVEYKAGSDNYRSGSHKFNFVMSGRQVGYYSTAANGIQFGTITEIQPTEVGMPWPDEWSEALKKYKK